MKIELKEITVRELTDGYQDDAEEGVVGYGGRLDIRPPYQREFIYKERQRAAVIDTIRKGYPLNVMYWAARDDGRFEVIDGQQRTVSVAQFINGDFDFEYRYFHNLRQDEKDQLLDYKLMIYQCTGTDSEKLEWFKTINIAGEELTSQELRNAVYAGAWLTDAKRYFSKSGCPAFKIAYRYLAGSAIRQEHLETAIKWLSENSIDAYMAKNQHEPNAGELWLYFQNVISWVEVVFPVYRKQMKGVAWGNLYNEFQGRSLDSQQLEEKIARLMQDDDVSNQKGIYAYVLSGKEKHLNIRAFSPNQKTAAYERQDGICAVCGEEFDLEEMEADPSPPGAKAAKQTPPTARCCVWKTTEERAQNRRGISLRHFCVMPPICYNNALPERIHGISPPLFLRDSPSQGDSRRLSIRRTIMNYEDRIVAFIDLLGFKSLVADTVRENGEDNKRAIQNIVSVYQNHINTLRGQSQCRSAKVSIMSDTVVISFKVNEQSEVYWVLSDIYHLICDLIEEKILCRGAVARGKLLHTGDYLFGPALVRAYELESKAAIYPRVIVDQAVIDAGARHHGPQHNSAQEEKYIKEHYLNKDLDGFYYVDYFMSARQDMPNDFRSYALRLKKFIEEGYSSKDISVWQKYSWLKERYNDMADEYNRDTNGKNLPKIIQPNTPVKCYNPCFLGGVAQLVRAVLSSLTR